MTVPEVEAPAPIKEIPDMVTPVQLHVPAGTVTVCPVVAEFTAFWTSVCEQLAAGMVLAFASRPKETVKRIAHNSHFNLVIGTVPIFDALRIFWLFWINIGRIRGQNPLYRRTVLGQLPCYTL
jgi:hypothetical protein